MCKDSGERSRALGLSCICEDYNANLKLYWLFEYGTSRFPNIIILNNLYVSTKCKVDLSTKAAHFGLSHTLKRSSKWPLFNFIFSNLALMLLKWILPEYMHFNGLKLSGALKEFSILSQFLGSKIKLLKKITVLSAFFRIEEWVISNPSSRLVKTPNLWFFAHERFFLWFFFKKANFPIFSKIIDCTYKYHCMRFILCKHVRPNTIQLDQPIFYCYSCKTGVHFRFYQEILKVI